MSTTGTLPLTGASVTVAGVALGQGILAAVAVGLVLAGALAVRYGFRRGQTPADAG